MEALEPCFEVHVQPHEAAFARRGDRVTQKRGADTAALVRGSDGRVEHEAVFPAVPGDVHEADEPRAVERRDVQGAAREDRREVARCVVVPGAREQVVQRVVRERRAAAVFDQSCTSSLAKISRTRSSAAASSSLAHSAQTVTRRPRSAGAQKTLAL